MVSPVPLALLVVELMTVSCQLIGSRGVISLRPGQVYRDSLTVEASEVAARLALLIQRDERLFGRIPHGLG